ncbi:uncharacterized protein N7515_008136 [Penicillium bovifimosum]|uniref:Xylanolytic transcriptional activator regulatory domain-containing protein n=1 Tax=Penicillium bovifimosum TaxID=126998 RepID=A0A9W9GMD9_9EURO|nr:uncharacterized protein N7515_008136 [Penicillium bovifimosum]KAJ5124311.1 hypothetical protein N7515_008136 [Penicillium bovifimosum]
MKIQESLHAYFENTAKLYPAIHPADTVMRIHEVLDHLQYPSSGLKIDVNHTTAPTIALLYLIMAISEKTARTLLQTFELMPPNLEILRCHTLFTIYLLHMDFLDLALQSIAVTVRLAMTLQLHRRSAPANNGSDCYDRNLWWMIYILDRDIACIAGVPYLIRDEEIEPPRPGRVGRLGNFSGVSYMPPSDDTGGQNEPEDQSFHRETMYLEVMAHLGRIWAHIWTGLFDNDSETDCQWERTEVLDAQLRVLQQRLPPDLSWKPPMGLGRKFDKDDEIIMQRQLVVLMRINTLRLLIRKTQTIESITALHASCEVLVPIAHPISTTLVQCILCLVNIIGDSTDSDGADLASASVVSAYQTLLNLSDHCVSARNAVDTLDEAFFRNSDGSSGFQASRITTAPVPHRRTGSHPEKQNGVPAAAKQTTRPSNLFDCLQQSYKTLDSLSTYAIPR